MTKALTCFVFKRKKKSFSVKLSALTEAGSAESLTHSGNGPFNMMIQLTDSLELTTC